MKETEENNQKEILETGFDNRKTNIIYKIIPHDHTSILNPSYFFDDFQEFYQ